ncbi:MAG: TIGR03067 domain-containing protein [bacterium]|nr:TIGR03067 domain-containing protein [bacterium]
MPQTLLLVVAISIGSAFPLLANDEGKDVLTGEWVVTAVHQGGKPDQSGLGSTFRFDAERFTIIAAKGGVMGGGKYTANTETDPAQIDLKGDEKSKRLPDLSGIYRFHNDALEICLSNKERPTSFKTSEEQPSNVKFTLERKPKPE